MKILQIIDKLDVGGAERVFVNLTNLLFDNNINVSALVFDNSGELQSFLNANLIVIQFQRHSKYNIKSSFKLYKILKNYDIVHVHMRHVYRYVKVVSVIYNLNTKIILHDHSSNFKKTPLLLNTILKPNYYIGVSQILNNWAHKKLKVKKQNCFLLMNTVIYKNYKNKHIDKKGAVIVGNIKPDKNQLFALKLAKRLEFNLTIIGNIQDERYYNLLKEEIKKLNLTNSVSFIHNEKDVQSQLHKYEFALNTSKRESGPLVLVEYLAQNLPFLSFKTGEISLILEKELPSFFINSFDEKEWLSNIKTGGKCSKDLKLIYDKLFSPKLYLNKCLSIYKKVKSC